MAEFAEKVLSYTEGMDQEAFAADTRTFDAVLRNQELIGEAATHIPQAVRDEHPETGWRRIVAISNRIVHGYLGIDEDVVWDIVQSDVPELLRSIQFLFGTTDE